MVPSKTTLFKQLTASVLALTFSGAAHASSDDIFSHAFHNNLGGPGFSLDVALDHVGIDRGYFIGVDKNLRIFPGVVPESERYVQDPELGDRAFKIIYPDGAKLKAIFLATTPDKIYAFLSAQTGIGHDVLASLISAKELSAFVLRHEIGHHGHEHGDLIRPSDRDERLEQLVRTETEADADAIRGIEAKNPQSRIRDVVYAYRVLDGVYNNALPLKYALEDKVLPPLPVVDFARRVALHSAVEELSDILRLDLKPTTNDYIDQNPEAFKTLVKDWKNMYVAADALRKPAKNANATLTPNAIVLMQP